MTRPRKINSMTADMFDTLLDKLDEKALSKRQIAVRNAIQRSFSKLDYILKMMEASHRKAIKQQTKNPSYKGYHGLDQDFVGQTEVHAESFYCEAHRLKKLFQDKGGFPGFKKLDLLAITFIRNDIVEHTKVDRDTSSWGSNYGPRLYVGIEPLCKKRPKIADKGFFPNVEEFYLELQTVLKQAIDNE